MQAVVCQSASLQHPDSGVKGLAGRQPRLGRRCRYGTATASHGHTAATASMALQTHLASLNGDVYANLPRAFGRQLNAYRPQCLKPRPQKKTYPCLSGRRRANACRKRTHTARLAPQTVAGHCLLFRPPLPGALPCTFCANKTYRHATLHTPYAS